MDSTRAIASCIACSLLIVLAGRLPLPGVELAYAISPLPLLATGGVAGLHAAMVAAGAVTAVYTLVLGLPAAVAYVLLCALPAAAALHLLWRGGSVERVVGTAALGSGAAAAMVVAMATHGDPAVGDLVEQGAGKSMAAAVDVYRNAGLSSQQVAALEAQSAVLVEWLVAMLPGLTAVAALTVWLVNLLLVRRWIPWPQLRELRLWQSPPAFIWVLIGAGFGMFLPVAGVSWLAGNLFLVVLAGYFCQGLAIVSFYFQRFRLPRTLRFLSYLLIALQHMIAAAVLALGVFDLWGDFRRLRPAATPAASDAPE